MEIFLASFNNRVLFRFMFFFILMGGSFTACRKSEDPFKGNNNSSFYSADVIDKWFTLEIRLFKDAKGISNGAFSRPFAYSGISAYESIDPGFASWKDKYNGLSDLPVTDKNKNITGLPV